MLVLFLTQNIPRPAFSQAMIWGRLLRTDTVNEVIFGHVGLDPWLEASITTAVAPL